MSGSYYSEDGQEVSGSGVGEVMWSTCPGQDGDRGQRDYRTESVLSGQGLVNSGGTAPQSEEVSVASMER